MGEYGKINNEKQEKIALINEFAETLNELKIESKQLKVKNIQFILKFMSRYQMLKIMIQKIVNIIKM